MTLREIILKTDFDDWVRRKSVELFGENPNYIRSLFLPIYSSLVRIAKGCDEKASGSIDISEDGVFVRFRINDLPVEKLLNVECEERDFDLVMWELARLGRNWK
jgi:hypothetical protein